MMRTKSREQVFRSLLATILNSDLSASDLRELSTELQGGPLPRELGHALEMIANQLSNSEPLPRESRVPDSDIDSATQLVKRRRIAKSKLGQIVKSLGLESQLPDIYEVTVEEFLRQFFLRASAAERDQLLSILEAPTKDDPYLAGIMKRLR